MPSPKSVAEMDSGQVRYRKLRYLYLGPILAAPLAHIGVTLYRGAKTPLQKRRIFIYGILGSTCLTVGARLWLMYDAGYPGSAITEETARQRVGLASESEMKAVKNPSLWKIVCEAMRGFG